MLFFIVLGPAVSDLLSFFKVHLIPAVRKHWAYKRFLKFHVGLFEFLYLSRLFSVPLFLALPIIATRGVPVQRAAAVERDEIPYP